MFILEVKEQTSRIPIYFPFPDSKNEVTIGYMGNDIGFGYIGMMSIPPGIPPLSRKHCKLINNGNGNWSVHDLGSRTGTYLAGRYGITPVTRISVERISGSFDFDPDNYSIYLIPKEESFYIQISVIFTAPNSDEL